MSMSAEYKKKRRKSNEDEEEEIVILENETTSNCKKPKSALLSKKSKFGETNRINADLDPDIIIIESEAAELKKCLEREREEKRKQQVGTLNLIKCMKKKWENAEKEKVSHLNRHIESQNSRIGELCSSNQDLHLQLQKSESELKLLTQELKKVKAQASKLDLKEYEKQLKNSHVTIFERNAELDELKKELAEKTKLLDKYILNEQTVLNMEEVEEIVAQNGMLRNQLEDTEQDLNNTLLTLKQTEKILLDMEQVQKEKKMYSDSEKEEDRIRKEKCLQDFVRKLEYRVSKLEEENASLKEELNIEKSTIKTEKRTAETIQKLREENYKLENKLLLTIGANSRKNLPSNTRRIVQRKLREHEKLKREKETSKGTILDDKIRLEENVEIANDIIKDSLYTDCPHCSKSFSKNWINRHLRMHRGDNTYKCQNCDYKTGTKAALNLHIKTHTL